MPMLVYASPYCGALTYFAVRATNACEKKEDPLITSRQLRVGLRTGEAEDCIIELISLNSRSMGNSPDDGCRSGDLTLL